MKINRLFEIVYLLMYKKSMTAKELAEYFEVSVRTILRDIETLSMTGIPIYTSQGKGGGVRLMDNFVLNKSVLTDKEQNDILTALHGLNAINVPDVEPVLHKLAALFRKNTNNWIDIDFSPWDSGADEQEKFVQLKSSILSQKLITFDYIDSEGKESHRTVEPLQIVFKERAWYLSSFCRDKNDYRTFKLRRIKRIEITEESFEARPLRKISNSFEMDNLCEVTLRISKDAEYRLRDEFDPEQVTLNEDGSFTVRALLPDNEWGYNYIISYGSCSTVMEPSHIRELVKNRFEAAARNYLV